MKFCAKLLAVFVAGVLLLSGCDQAGTSGASGSGIAVIDLTVIAKATGQDEAIRVQADAARNELGSQLQQLAADLDAQLQAEREKLGEPLSEADAQRMQELSVQAQQQLANAQQQAQQQAAQMEQALVAEFRNSVGPLAEKIAQAQGAQTVLVADSYMLWFEPAIDITDEVIAAWRAAPPDSAENAADDSGTAQAELEVVEEELQDAAEELAEAEGEIELLESLEEALESDETTE